jgi:murein DD-endopeptidase MepM/ murein hydrolase activator NlpD
VKTESSTNAVAHQPTAKDQAKTAAKQLEAFFLRQMLAEARPKGGGMLEGGFAGDTFKDMLDEQLADKMSGAGGFGMAEMFTKQLGGSTQELPHSAPVMGPSFEGMPQFASPVPGGVGSGFGARVGHDGTTHQHPGLDLWAKTGDSVSSAASGTVDYAGPAGTYGNLVIVKHENGYSTRYAHLSHVGVKVGEHVDVGQQLGNAGSTGLSDAPHLHFEVRKGDQAIDPTALLPLNGSKPRASR